MNTILKSTLVFCVLILTSCQSPTKRTGRVQSYYTAPPQPTAQRAAQQVQPPSTQSVIDGLKKELRLKNNALIVSASSDMPQKHLWAAYLKEVQGRLRFVANHYKARTIFESFVNERANKLGVVGVSKVMGPQKDMAYLKDLSKTFNEAAKKYGVSAKFDANLKENRPAPNQVPVRSRF